MKELDRKVREKQKYKTLDEYDELYKKLDSLKAVLKR